MRAIFVLIFFIFNFYGCTKKLEYSKSEVWALAKKENPSVELVIPKDMNSGIQCGDYGEGCITGFKVRIGVLEAVVIQFDEMKNARKEAKRIDQYYKYNWVFDNVTDEPRLERFFEKVYQAVRPMKHRSTSRGNKVKSI